MSSMAHTQEGNGLLRWGGMAGLLGGALMLFVFVFVGAVVGPDPAGPEGPVTRFPEIRAARTLENSLYLVVMALWAIHVMVLSRALSGTSPAPALVGRILGTVGLTILAAGALPHVVTTRLSDLYHAPGATPQDQATVALLWQANQGLFDALLASGLFLLPLGLVALGVAMLRAPAFGRRFAAATVALGVAALGGASAFILDPRTAIVAVGFLALIVFNLVLGWKAFRLANAPGVVRAGLADLRVTESPLSA
jgi:hypothetical protein